MLYVMALPPAVEEPHNGPQNVSVVNLATQTPIGSPLISWPVYANDSLGPSQWPPGESQLHLLTASPSRCSCTLHLADFTVTIPATNGACATAGACAIQWFWWAYNGQTYESCIDFTSP